METCTLQCYPLLPALECIPIIIPLSLAKTVKFRVASVVGRSLVDKWKGLWRCGSGCSYVAYRRLDDKAMHFISLLPRDISSNLHPDRAPPHRHSRLTDRFVSEPRVLSSGEAPRWLELSV
jgi:hypothetical protein